VSIAEAMFANPLLAALLIALYGDLETMSS
jgi:hypothetical protein